MFSRNPSEYQRMIEERNEQMKTWETSRNSNTEHHRKCQTLRDKRKRLQKNSPPLCKSDKEVLLREIHALEKDLGLELTKYNGKN